MVDSTDMNIGIDYVDKIFHIADIHIRNLKRHTEYRDVFESFYKEIQSKKTKDSIIYLAGDIVHAKTEMSPELIRLVSELFRRLAEICPVIVIPGNHDANLNNPYRLDVLSPIVENMNNDRIVYIKHSGIYNIANLKFVHYGIFEDKEDWPDLSNSDGTYIGLFHGPIHTARTDIGYEVSNRSITSDVFTGCQAVMCGDIHKRQIMESSDDMVVVYPGSMIQQNHGESLENHGFVEWDFDEAGHIIDCKFVDIKNKWGYYTLNIDNGVVPIVDDMPEIPRLRIRVTNTTASDLKRALATVRSNYNANEFTVTRMDTLSRLNAGNRDNKLNLGNVSDIEYQNELIKDYLDRNLFVDESTINDIFDINRNLNAQLDENDIAKNVNWKPKKFTFSNMFSYGENNHIDFTDMKGAYGLFAPNASGKSSIFDAISFCIFDKCSRAYKAAHIMNNQKNNFECKLELEIDGVSYFIQRSAKRKKDGSVKVDVNFWKDVDGNEINLNGEHRRGTNDIIRRYIGSYDDFVLTTLSLQNKNAIFIDKSQSERKDLLAQFMGIDIFDKLYQIAAENIKDVNSQIRKMKSIDYDTKLVEYKSQLKVYKKSYKNKKKELSDSKKEYTILTAAKLNLVRDIVKVNPEITNIESLERNKKSISENIKSIQSELDHLSLDIKEKKKSIESITARIRKYESEDIESRNVVYKEKKRKEAELILEIDSIRTEIERKTEQLYEYGGLEYDLDCSYCIENADKLKSSSILIKKEKKECTIEMKKLIVESNELSDFIKANSSIESDWNDYSYLLSNKSKKQIDLAKLERSHAERKSSIQKYQSSLKDNNTSINEYYKLEESIKSNNTLNKEISSIDSDIVTLDQKIDMLNDELLRINGNLATTKTNLDKCNEDLNLLKELENIYKTYEYYLTAIKRDGIPYELIMKALPLIEGEVNNILQQVVDFGMQLEMDGKSINGKLVYETSSWPLEMCSGMERFISGLAIRVALMNICHLPRSNFLVIDEGMGTLDSNNINNLSWLFDYLKGQFDYIMVISHLDVMRDIIDNLIEIKKEDKFSSVNY